MEADSLPETSAKSTKRGRNSSLVVKHEEKRAARTRYSMNQDVTKRVDRALSQRLYLLNQIDISTPNNLGRKYDVLGSTGNVYEVEISRIPSCTCPDAAKGNLCKHILFVYLRVLKLQPRSKVIIQKALLQEELATTFTSKPMTCVASDVQASKSVMRIYSNSMQGSQSLEDDHEEKIDKEDSEETPQGECPICFESMATKESINRCQTCRNSIHVDCLRRWLDQSKTCVYCRSVWVSNLQSAGPVSASQMGDYLNIS